MNGTLNKSKKSRKPRQKAQKSQQFKRHEYATDNNNDGVDHRVDLETRNAITRTFGWSPEIEDAIFTDLGHRSHGDFYNQQVMKPVHTVTVDTVRMEEKADAWAWAQEHAVA